MIELLTVNLPNNGNLADQGAGLGVLIAVAFVIWLCLPKKK